MPALTLAEAQRLFAPAGVYVNTASYGLPPAPAWDELQAALADWRGGRTSWEGWGEATERARASFARLVGRPTEAVAVGATVSELTGSLVTALPDGARVVVPEIEFTSTLFPLLVQERLSVRTVPAADLADAIADGADAAVFSAVQMSTGERADLEAIAAAARDANALTLCDATQAAGWLPLDGCPFDAIVCAAYKWLLSPRGTAFAAVSDRLLADVVPHSAGWYAGEDVARLVLRAAAAPRADRPAPRRLARVVLLGRRRAGAGADRGRRASRRSTITTSAWPTASAPAWACPRPTARSCRPRCPAPRRGWRRRGSSRRSAAAVCAPRGICTTRRRTSTASST